MFNLACHIPCLYDATSFYRAAGPLSRLRKDNRQLSLNLFENWNWATIGLCDALYMQRPHTKEHVTIMEMAKDRGLKVWVDYDDFLFEVPEDNPTFFLYNKPETQQAVANCLHLADKVTVSTRFLHQQIGKFNQNMVVIPNCLDTLNIPQPNIEIERTKLVTWRGSRTHQRDVMGYCDPIIKSAKKYTDWTYQFIGDNLWFLTNFLPHDRAFVSPPMDVMEYLRHLRETAGSVMIVPLHDSNFNKCKSNIAYLEAVYAGMVAIGPDWEEWKQPGCLTYNNQNDFGMNLDLVMSGELNIKKINSEAQAHVKEHYNLQTWNKVRADIVAELMGIKTEQLL